MASKKTDKSTARKAPAGRKPLAVKTAAVKVKKEPKKTVSTAQRHPRARVLGTSQGSKEALAKALSSVLAAGDESADTLATRLKTASNAQLLRLQKVADTVQKKYGSRAGLIEAIGKSKNKSKDKDYIAKLESLSLPNLLDLAVAGERRARA